MAQRRRQPDPATPEDNFEVGEEVVDIYCDSFHINTGLYSSTLYLAVSQVGKPDRLLVRVKVSPQMLRAMSLLTSKHVRDYQGEVGPISLPNRVVHDWGLEEEIK